MVPGLGLCPTHCQCSVEFIRVIIIIVIAASSTNRTGFSSLLSVLLSIKSQDKIMAEVLFSIPYLSSKSFQIRATAEPKPLFSQRGRGQLSKEGKRGWQPEGHGGRTLTQCARPAKAIMSLAELASTTWQPLNQTFLCIFIIWMPHHINNF